MQLFYAPEIDSQQKYILSVEESVHCITVLRYKAGQHLRLTDGKGYMYDAVIDGAAKKFVTVTVIGSQKVLPDRSYRLHIAIAPTKSIERFEWFVEKATEIGIDEITPIVTEKSERKTVRIDRLEKIAIAAMKQSIKAYLPRINPLSGFSEFMQNHPLDRDKFIAYCNEYDRPLLQTSYTRGRDAVVLIGPEGDFSRREIENATDLGFRSVSLGSSRLRSETAGIVVCNTLYFINQ
jgi:16S rRNA (uracil1498-N3)-methyltransferase